MAQSDRASGFGPEGCGFESYQARVVFLKNRMSKVLIVLVTIPQNKAKAFAKKLLKQRLCACVNVIKGVESFFWWKGKIDTAKEALLLIKTKDSNFIPLKKLIESIHPY